MSKKKDKYALTFYSPIPSAKLCATFKIIRQSTIPYPLKRAQIKKNKGTLYH